MANIKLFEVDFRRKIFGFFNVNVQKNCLHNVNSSSELKIPLSIIDH